jgi:hypothetical protein
VGVIGGREGSRTRPVSVRGYSPGLTLALMALRRGSVTPIVTIVAKTNVAALNAAVALCISIAMTRLLWTTNAVHEHMVS